VTLGDNRISWALRTFPRDEVELIFHDIKEEHEDTYTG
jgi:hypothetical protein